MTPQLQFPKSFPNAKETDFLTMLLCDDRNFPARFAQWKASVVFDDIDYATLRLLPLLAIRLRALGISDSDTARIQGVYKLAWVSNQRLVHAVTNVVRLLESGGVPVIILKGLPLLFSTYKDIGARFLGDGDILIDPQKIALVIKLMYSQGWRIKSASGKDPVDFSVRRLTETVKELTFVNDTEVEVDVHLHVFCAPSESGGVNNMPFEELLASAMTVSFRGHNYLSMSAEDLFLHVVVHGAEGNIHRGLRWVTDAVSILSAFKLDWDALIERAERRGFAVELYMACAYLHSNKYISLPTAAAFRIFSVPLDNKTLRAYYAKGRRLVPYPLFGNIPRLWREYWKYEAPSSSITHLYGFIGSATKAWGLRRKRDLPLFIIKKYKERITRFYRQRKTD